MANKTVTTKDEVVEEYPIETAEDRAVKTQNWLMLGALAVAALAFAVIVVLVAKTVYNHTHNQTVTNKTSDLPEPPPSDLQPGR